MLIVVGDALGIYPQNNPADVRMLLDTLKCSGTEQVNKPSWAYQVFEDSDDGLYVYSLHFCPQFILHFIYKYVTMVTLRILCRMVCFFGNIEDSE